MVGRLDCDRQAKQDHAIGLGREVGCAFEGDAMPSGDELDQLGKLCWSCVGQWYRENDALHGRPQKKRRASDGHLACAPAPKQPSAMVAHREQNVETRCRSSLSTLKTGALRASN